MNEEAKILPDSPVRCLHGIGPKAAENLAALGIFSVEDLLRLYPADYDRAEPVSRIKETENGVRAAVQAVIEGLPRQHGFGKETVLTFRVTDGTGRLQISFFHMPYLKSTLKPDTEHVFRGVIRETKYGRQMDHPRVASPEEYKRLVRTILPVYELGGALTQTLIRKVMPEALKAADLLEDPLPAEFFGAEQMPLGEAIRQMHFPDSEGKLAAARSRLVFEEFLLFILKIRLLKAERVKQGNSCPMPEEKFAQEAVKKLPYKLTAAQVRSFEQIRDDLRGAGTMNRLLQGDVGSGKTAVALLAMLTAAENGYQSALMAPTEVLARQHYEKLSALIRSWDMPVRTAILTGSQRAAERRENLALIESGQAALVIGTHALIQEKVRFHRLGLVITDEQHRFGVRQRGLLGEKGQLPHALVMSATPIPRTLAIILYGDLDVSVIDERPVGRLPIRSAVVSPAARNSAYKLILKEIEAGHQAYIICPLVEESEAFEGENVEEYSERLRDVFPKNIQIGRLHGRMKPEEKDAVMEDFLRNRIQILVSTTVVEVGVDVPNATVLMVENAERFGLAQLHQLRGRVGRSDAQSYAVFVDA